MSIIEVMFAVVIMSGVMLALSRFGQEFTRATRNASTLGIASDLATARLEVIRAYPNYADLSTFEGTESGASAYPSMADFDGYSRETKVVARTTTLSKVAVAEYTTVTVTVTVSRPTLVTVSKSLDIAAP